MPSNFSTTPPPGGPPLPSYNRTETAISFPTSQILLVTLTRPAHLNAIGHPQHHELAAIYNYLDAHPTLRLAILTGEVTSEYAPSFCAGMDLAALRSFIEAREKRKAAGESEDREGSEIVGLPEAGFGGMSKRVGKKPIIAAVDGVCFGGGFEMVLNADLVVASERSRFRLPETGLGLVPFTGLSRIVELAGLQRGTEVVLAGREVGAKEGYAWGFINRIARNGADVVDEAVNLAEQVIKNSRPFAGEIARKSIKNVGIKTGEEIARDNFEAGAVMLDGEELRNGLVGFLSKSKKSKSKL
ncbi:ClpP/crotonase [Ascobolus immersus RN42]|uniref:ClpP/crotonase n=1 Tax=Ascobolus immersus RN42 TaxID=1160509 RepID=A0A3N4IKN6_ASCIM|nr:ClpP/crotonase [Ascobolus immersus RN42]